MCLGMRQQNAVTRSAVPSLGIDSASLLVSDEGFESRTARVIAAVDASKAFEAVPVQPGPATF